MPSNRSEYNQQRWQAYKARIWEIQKARGCAVCGYRTFSEALDFHHLEPADFRLAAAFTIGWGRVCEEIEKCVVLCANCHRAIHRRHLEDELWTLLESEKVRLTEHERQPPWAPQPRGGHPRKKKT